jgi:iron-sulfur cluster assembly protein
MAIILTESAAKQIRNQLAKRGKGLGLRVGVKKVGCSGFAYTFDYADEYAGDRIFELNNAKVVVDADGLSFSRRFAARFRQERLSRHTGSTIRTSTAPVVAASFNVKVPTRRLVELARNGLMRNCIATVCNDER